MTGLIDSIHYFTSAPTTIPARFPNPFSCNPHPLAQHAARDLQQRLNSGWDQALHAFDTGEGGKMFGVLVVRDARQRIGYLSAFSGMLGGSWQVSGFVPPIFDAAHRESLLPAGEATLAAMTQQIDALEKGRSRQSLLADIERQNRHAEQERARLAGQHEERRAQRHRQRSLVLQMADDRRARILHSLSLASQHDRSERRELNRQWNILRENLQQRLAVHDTRSENWRRRRARMSRRLQQQLFSGYGLKDGRGRERPLMDCFPDALPPGGSGDCAAPKLLQYAHFHGLQPLALAEFWWGRAPATGVRHHGHFYPACRGKCGPILPFMLGGLDVEPAPFPGLQKVVAAEPTVVYEDEALVVVNKPVGLLSVPGKQLQDSVLTRLRQRYPDADGPLLVHRLDMSTSGLLLAAKSAAVHKALQKQFIRRQVQKRYVAVLETGEWTALADEGRILLPLRVDIDDRPRQRVCYDHGKSAETRWRVIERCNGQTRVHFYPLTGRTHQLRVHAAHRDGLAAPIIGDELYGRRGERLLLHAERLRFFHPLLKEEIEVSAPVPF